MKNNKWYLPTDIFDYAYIYNYEQKIEFLADNIAEGEQWHYEHTPTDVRYPILSNYIKQTYKRVAEEEKVVLSHNEDKSCFNTGLVTEQQESIYMVFTTNTKEDARQYWFFDKFLKASDRGLMNYFPGLPEMADYYEDPCELVYDVRMPLECNYEHITEDNHHRFPASYQDKSNFELSTLLKGAVDVAVKKIRRNYKVAIPQFYNHDIQLLLPLCFTDPKVADLALVVRDCGDYYVAQTCLLPWMAMNNARLIAKPDREWLRP
jgi:hypothetical protein